MTVVHREQRQQEPRLAAADIRADEDAVTSA
jgi:hypothetical protein